jgi:CDP-diacylglycerol--serine O-phosphatidyltransferase
MNTSHYADKGSRRLHQLADVLTGCNLAAGMAAAFIRGDTRSRSRLILIGALCDSLDGPLARRSGHLTDEGARADGICDVVTCGFAPPILLGSVTSSHPSLIDRLAPRLYIAAITWRVIKYGFPPRESHVFTGMPITGAGVTMAVGFQLRLPPRAMSYLTLAVVGMMLSRVPILSGEAILRRDVRERRLPTTG